MATFTVRRGRRYRATITLDWLERWVDNETIAEKLHAAGFTEVNITGAGDTRQAAALWPKPDATAEMPSQVSEVSEIPARTRTRASRKA